MKHSFILLLFILILVSCSKQTQKEKGMNKEENQFFIGTYTSDSSQGIYEAVLLNDGSLSDLKLVGEAVNPSFLAWNEDKGMLYSVNEVQKGGVSSFKYDEDLKSLEMVNHVSSEGASPCHVSISHSGKFLSSSNYSSGNVNSYAVLQDGSLGDNTQSHQNQGTLGPTKRQEKPHAHCGMFSKDDRFLYVVDLGLDEIIAYPIDKNGLTSEFHTALKLDPGDGPRHLIFHPTKNLAFVINELSNTIVSMKVDPQEGRFEKIDKQSTLPPGFTGQSNCADIHITGDGKYLYGSNRGHNSIAVFEVSQDGKLQFLETEKTQGDWPRNFAISPSEKYLLVANQKSSNVTVFTIDPETGRLDFTGNDLKVFNPVCLVFQ